MYGATKPKLTRPNPQGNSAADDNEQMQPLMVDPYFDKSFSPEPNTFSAFKLAAVVTTIAIIIVIGIAVTSRGSLDERSQNEKTDPFYVNKLSRMMMPNGWIRLRAATTAASKYTKPTGYIFLSQYEYGGTQCDEETLQIQHGTVTGVCVSGQDAYGDMSTSGVYSCKNQDDKIVWEFEQFNSTDCTGDTLKVSKYEYPVGCSVGDKIDEKYVFQAGCTQQTVAPYTDITKDGYLLGSAITDASCDAGDEFYYSWVKTNTCLKGLDEGQGSRKFSECSGMSVTVSLFTDPDCSKQEYSSATSFECDVTDDYFYYYYDDKSTEEGTDAMHVTDDAVIPPSAGNATTATAAAGAAAMPSATAGALQKKAGAKSADYYADDDEADDKEAAAEGDDSTDEIEEGDDAGRRKRARARKLLLKEYTTFKSQSSLRQGSRGSDRRRVAEADDDKASPPPAPAIHQGADDDADDDSANDDLAIFRNFVFGKCVSQGHVTGGVPTPPPAAPTRHQTNLDQTRLD